MVSTKIAIDLSHYSIENVKKSEVCLELSVVMSSNHV